MSQTSTTIMKDLGYDPSFISSFRQAILRSGRPSIDVFLATRPDFMDIGKAAIALALLPIEQKDHLFHIWPRARLGMVSGSPDERGQPHAKKSHGHWYELLFNAMVDDDLPLQDVRNNKVSIVTFNYDRSLEHYLMNALMNTFNRAEVDVAQVLNKIEIIHVHGALGKLPWQPGDGSTSVQYGIATNPSQIKVASSCIKVLREGQNDGPEFTRARQLLRDARRVHFLGFGFNKTNIERLGISAIPSPPAVGATGRGLSHETLSMLHSIPFFGSCFGPLGRVPTHDEDVYSYLHDHVALCS